MVRRLLEDELAEHRLRPGDRVNEQELSKRLGVSRTPVREALLELASLGYFSFRSRQGMVVARMSLKRIMAMWEVLASLEVLCAELAARRMLPGERTALAALHGESRKLVDGNDHDGYESFNARFHELIYAGARNAFLTQQIRNIRQRIQIYRGKPFAKPGRMEQSFRSHDQILAAIQAGDGREAGLAMKEHVQGGLSLLDFVAELPVELTEDDEADAPA